MVGVLVELKKLCLVVSGSRAFVFLPSFYFLFAKQGQMFALSTQEADQFYVVGNGSSKLKWEIVISINENIHYINNQLILEKGKCQRKRKYIKAYIIR